MFFTFEGTECSGKTSVINFLKEYLEIKGYKVLVTREPGGTYVSEQIRDVILNKDNDMHKYTEMILYAASRVEHVYNKIIPALNDGYIVLCDRFLDSSLAYQSYGRGIDLNIVLGYNSLILNHLPDKTFFFNISPNKTLDRLNLRDSKVDRLDLEDISFHNRVYNGYLELLELYSDRFIEIDATKDLEELKILVLAKILDLLENE